MIVLDNITSYSINITKLESIYNLLSNKEVELLVVYDEQMQRYNYDFRNINKTTDVLSFPIEDISGNEPLGSIIINLDYAYKVSNQLQHSLDEEIAILFIHGVLHLLGFDHETDMGEMRTKELELAKVFQLPTTLIGRIS